MSDISQPDWKYLYNIARETIAALREQVMFYERHVKRIREGERDTVEIIGEYAERYAKMEAVVEAAWAVSLSMDTMPGAVMSNAPIWGNLTTLQCALAALDKDE